MGDKYLDSAGSNTSPYESPSTAANNLSTFTGSVVAAEVLDILLSGPDLPSGILTLVVDAVYSSTDGIGLPLRDSARFVVADIMD